MYTKTCKCYCWAALNKVSLLLISSLYCCCFFSQLLWIHARCPPAEQHKASCSFSCDFCFCLLKYQFQGLPTEPLAASSPPRPFLSPPVLLPAPGESGHHCSQALSEEDASAAGALCPVQDPFCLHPWAITWTKLQSQLHGELRAAILHEDSLISE